MEMHSDKNQKQFEVYGKLQDIEWTLYIFQTV